MTDIAKSPNRILVEQWCERVWRQRDASAMDDLFESSGTAEGLGGDPRIGPNEMREFHSAICDLLMDTSMELDQVIEQDGKLACLCTFRGSCKRSGNKVTTGGAMFFEFDNDKIVKGVNRFEFMEMFEQLGLLPEHSFAKALGGNVVA